MKRSLALLNGPPRYMSDTSSTAATAVSSKNTSQQQPYGDESGPYVLRKLDLDIALSEDGTRDDIHITCVDFWGESHRLH